MASGTELGSQTQDSLDWGYLFRDFSNSILSAQEKNPPESVLHWVFCYSPPTSSSKWFRVEQDIERERAREREKE